MKTALIKRISLCLLLCGAVITGQQRDQKPVDGPISVKLGDVFKKGKINIEAADLSTLPALPHGYAAMPNMAYRITTDAIAVGPYTVVFGVASVTDEDTFYNLRVFHAEPDEFDPDSPVWVDRTATEADASPRSFVHRTITAYSDELETGIYLIARLAEKRSPITTIADLEVVAPPAPEVVQMPAHITMSVTVKNNGPATATDIGLKQQMPRGPVVSMKPSQGSCKWKPGWVYCKLGQLSAGGSATIAVEIDLGSDFVGQYRTYVEVAGKEIDRNTENNWTVATADTLGDPNLAPEVTLESPEMEQLFERGATVLFKATAKDADGSITKVEFLDNGKTVGVGSTSDYKTFSFSSDQLVNGFHVLTAVATDNGGRSTESGTKQVFVNGPIKVRILKPKTEDSLAAGSDLILTAVATNPFGSIKKVEFFYNGGFPLGEAGTTGGNRYSIELRDLAKTNYSIQAVATDQAGYVSKSATLRFNVTK